MGFLELADTNLLPVVTTAAGRSSTSSIRLSPTSVPSARPRAEELADRVFDALVRNGYGQFDDAPSSAAADIRHLRRHHGHELDVGLERQAGHIGDPARDIVHVDAGFGLDLAAGLQTASAVSSLRVVAALPMSIWPQAMSYWRPSSDNDLVRPVSPCLVAA